MNGVNFVVTGDDINTDSAIIISNHKSLVDFIAMAYLARYTNDMLNNEENEKSFKNLTLPRINFFTWFKLWRIPSIRVLINLAKCDENWELESSLSKIVFGKILKSKVPEWIVLFPEVNIWTEEDSSLQKAQGEKFYLPTLQNILYPRFSAFYNVISTLNSKEHSKFNQLYDVSVLYESKSIESKTPTNKASKDESNAVSSSETPQDKGVNLVSPNLLEIFSSDNPITIHIHVKSKRLLRVPTKRSKIEKWLENTWVEKDKFLDQWKTDLSKATTFSVNKGRTPQNSPPQIKTGVFRLGSIKSSI
jgi:1-acyl-sn-glycerol-3-phosphate acyltransferase